MEHFLIYLAKVAIGIAVFFLFYRLVLGQLKQFRFNRIYLAGSLCLSFVIPFITLTIVRPAIRRTVILPGSLPAEQIAAATSGSGVELTSILLYIYLTILIIMLFHLVTGHLKAIGIILKSRTLVIDGTQIFITEKEIHPFTFFNKIVISADTMKHPQLGMILMHEKVHVREKHTFDIFLSEVLFLLQWFNPFAWFYKNAVRNNLEFLTDHLVIDHTDRQDYQMALVTLAGKKAVSPYLNALNGSNLKNRIIMMKKNSTSRFSLLRKMILLPVVILLITGLSGKTYKSAAAQDGQFPVKGSVSGIENGKTIPGAMVLVTGTTMGTITDQAGNYMISIPRETDTLVFITQDHLKKEVPVNGKKEINVMLKLKETELKGVGSTGREPSSSLAKSADDVVVIGYGTPKNVKSVKGTGETVLGSPIQRQGEPFTTGSQKNTSSVSNIIRIRTEGQEPAKDVLYMLDGKEIKNLDVISPDEIESISVLKNESATAVYGEKGKNGVIIITSKNSSQKAGDPLIILDGKETTKKVSDINPENIQSVNVMKGESATQKYGEKAKNGVIEISMKSGGDERSSMIRTIPELREFIAKSVRYPVKAQEAGQQGMVLIYAFINDKGEITQITESKPMEETIKVDEVVIVGYAGKPGGQSSFGSLSALSQEAALQVKILPDLGISEFLNHWVVFQFKFLLQ